MKTTWRVLVVLLSVFLMITGFAVGQVPQLINYQGVLIDPGTGLPVPDNTYSITFSIYDVASGGSAIWTELQSVQTKNGLYSVTLGSTTPLTPDILSATEKYLGIKVGSDPEMTPRKRIVSVAYAITSSGVSGASNIFPSDGNVGIGTTTPQKPLDVAASGGISISLTDSASSNNEVFFQDNGQIRSLDDNHRIIFDRSANILELREYGDIVFSPGAINGERTNEVTFKSSGNVGIGTTIPSNETKLHIQAVSDDFGVLVDGEGTSGSEIGLHSASSKYASLAKNAYFASGVWQRFDASSGAYLQEVQPGGDVLFRTIGAGANPISWTDALTIKTDGTVKMAGFQLTASPTAGYVLTTDASGVGTWQPSGGFTLPYSGSASTSAAVFEIDNTGSGDGIYGEALGESAKGIWGSATGTGGHGIYGEATGNTGKGVYGLASATGSTTNYGGMFIAYGQSGQGVHSEATGTDGVAVYAISQGGQGIHSEATGTDAVAVYANSQYGKAVDALTSSASTNEWTPAIYGRNEGAGDGVYGWSQNHHGTVGVTYSTDANHAGVYGVNNGTGYAARFDGKVKTGVLEIAGGSDLSEQFEIGGIRTDSLSSAGMVVSIDPENPGDLIVSDKEYDRRVAGIISGAGGIEPGMVMGQAESVADGEYPVAMTGRVYCWADASNSPIKPGDLLTTSTTPGHAMKVIDYAKAQGAVIGKAMSSLEEGQDLILVLVTLQ